MSSDSWRGPDWEIVQALDTAPEYCSCSCHMSQHEYSITPVGGIAHCKTPYHRCDRPAAMSSAKLQAILHDVLKETGNSRARRIDAKAYRASDLSDVISAIKGVEALLRSMEANGVRRR